MHWQSVENWNYPVKDIQSISSVFSLFLVTDLPDIFGEPHFFLNQGHTRRWEGDGEESKGVVTVETFDIFFCCFCVFCLKKYG